MFHFSQEYSLINSSFNDIFDGINEIIVLSQYDDINEINFDTHECVIFEHIPHENGLYFDDILILNEGETYELRLIMTINFLSDIKYNSQVYSRHGGVFKKWWLQEKIGKNKKFPTQIDGSVEFNKDSSVTVAYIRLHNNNILQKISSELLQYIGGQSHMICHKHKIPLVPIPDRKIKYICGHFEH